MTDTIQKLREACNYIDALGGDSRSYRQALALQTAVPESLEALSRKLDTQMPDPEAGEMTNGLTQAETDASASVSGLTAVPVGEREAFIVSASLIKETTTGFNMQNKLYEVAAASRDEAHGKVLPLIYVDFPEHRLHTICSYPITSPALSAGDAVDAQRYRWLREQSDDDFAFAVVKNPHFDVYESPEELDFAIDAAMRKEHS